VKSFQGLVLKADRLLYHSNLGSRVMKKKKTEMLAAFVPDLLTRGGGDFTQDGDDLCVLDDDLTRERWKV